MKYLKYLTMISATKSQIIQEAAKPGEEGHAGCMGFATK